jgi:NADPH-dependent 2,4-dienoyl-CoA reductase/sulfur reductase-like enzyme
MTRAHLADPYIVRKVAAGIEDRIRPCVGATYCLDRIYQGGEALCIHNAATGREAQMLHEVPKTAVARRVVIVGAGPAGLEAARVAGERGHTVTVLEAADRAGGQIRLLVQNPWRRELIGIVDWRLAELAQLGVEVRYNVIAEAEDVLALDPDVVVVATGGLPQGPEMSGLDLTTSSWEVISGEVKPAGRILVYDDGGAHAGMTAAVIAARAGAEVELVSPERFLAPDMGGMNHVPYMAAFHATGTRVTINTRVVGVRREGNWLVAVLGSDYAPGWQEERRVDRVVVEHATAANAGLRIQIDSSAVSARTQPGQPVARLATMCCDGDHEQSTIRRPIDDAEREALDQQAAGALVTRGARHRVAQSSIERILDSRLKPDTRTFPCFRVVLDLMKQLGFGLRQEAKSFHRAIARALAKTSSAASA